MKTKHASYTDQEVKEAKSWFSSLPAGRKSYFKKHYRLTRDEDIVRFYVNNVKGV